MYLACLRILKVLYTFFNHAYYLLIFFLKVQSNVTCFKLVSNSFNCLQLCNDLYSVMIFTARK